MKKYQLALWSSILLPLAAVPLEAANLLQNPNFSGSLASWVAPYATYDSTRSATADGTGSALGGFTLPSNAAYGNANGVEQCVNGIVPGTSYDFGGKVLIPGGQVDITTRLVGLRNNGRLAFETRVTDDQGISRDGIFVALVSGER
ncbi:MAG: hypothetical protein ACHQPI_00655 [Thermoanaerobaculia bacterium]